MITFPDLPGVVASGARPEEAIRHGRDALEVYCRTATELERTATELERASERPVPLISTDAPPRRQ
jgi:predicted RNase H-like HicB family nuclease